MKTNSLNVASVGKAFLVLQCFEKAEGDLSLSDIVRLSGLDKSAAQRFTHTLRQCGYLDRDTDTRRYRLSKKVLDLTFHFLRSNSLLESVNPSLIELCHKTGEKISFSLFDDCSLVYVMRQQIKMEYYYSSLIGRRVPVFCTAGGRAILASLDPKALSDVLDRSELMPFTSSTVTDKAAIIKEVDIARNQGYALVVEQFAYGEIALGAAVLDSNRMPVAAVHISGSLSDWEPDDFVKRCAPLLLETTQRINRR